MDLSGLIEDHGYVGLVLGSFIGDRSSLRMSRPLLCGMFHPQDFDGLFPFQYPIDENVVGMGHQFSRAALAAGTVQRWMLA